MGIRDFAQGVWEEGTLGDYILLGGIAGAVIGEAITPTGMEGMLQHVNSFAGVEYLEGMVQHYHARSTALWEGIGPAGQKLDLVERAKYWVSWEQAWQGAIPGGILGAIGYGLRVKLGGPHRQYTARNE